MPSHNRRYVIHFGGAMLAYMVVLFASVWALTRYEMGEWLAGAVALTPMLPALYALHAFVIRYRTMDEFQRRIVGESILWSAGIVGFATFGYGFLHGATSVPPLNPIWILPAIIAGYGVVQCILFWRVGR